MEDNQQTAEGFRAMAAYIEETIERDEHALGDLSDEEREEVVGRVRWRRRELADVRRRLDQLEEDLFAMSVLGDIKGL